MSNISIDQFGNKAWLTDREFHRIGGPAVEWKDGSYSWYINNIRYENNQSYQKAAKLTDEDMLATVLKYGNVK